MLASSFLAIVSTLNGCKEKNVDQITVIKKLALSGKFTNAQVCALVGVTDAELQRILETLVRTDRAFQRASGLLTG